MGGNRLFIKALAGFTLLSMVPALTACSSGAKFNKSSFESSQGTVVSVFEFTDNDASAKVTYDSGKISEFQTYTKNLQVEYPYSELFDYDKAMEGIYADHTVAKHEYSALDSNGKLTAEHLLEVVNENTAAYVEEQNTGFIKALEDEELTARICEIIADTVNDMLEKYPGIDRDRVYCNLGYLKIIQKAAVADSYAGVEPGMVLYMNPNTAMLKNYSEGSNMYDVIIHEAMHILQYGCTCENIDGCVRRAGMAHSYEAWEQDYSDWTWIEEASAERMMSLYANVEPASYVNAVNYITSLDIATALQGDVTANYLETLSFYGDADKLFDLFVCGGKINKEEIYQMLYSLEIIQMDPDDVQRAYTNIYGEEWSDDVSKTVANTLKRSAVMTMTKVFYETLSQAVTENEFTQNDLYFLVNLYETAINRHLAFDNSEYDDYNADFLQWYKTLREKFFDCFSNADLDGYTAYEIMSGDTTINAALSRLDSDKKSMMSAKLEAADTVYKIAQ